MSEKQQAILDLFKQKSGWTVDGDNGCISISNDEGLDAFLYAGDTQIVVETVLFPASMVQDSAALDAQVLRTHRIIPLTTVGVSQINGEDYYVAFGALSIDSKDEVLIEEVETLFSNVPEFIELYSEHLSSN